MIWLALSMIWIMMLIVSPERTATLTVIGGLMLFALRQLWVWYEDRQEGGS